MSMSNQSLIDVVRALLAREQVVLCNDASTPLDPVRESFVLHELVSLVQDGLVIAPWDEENTSRIVVDKRLLDACRVE